MPKALLRAAAIRDTRDIRAYSKANHGLSAARSYLMGLTTILEMLADRPMTGRSETSLYPGLRSFGFHSHRIYYFPIDGSIDVVRVLHQSQDVSAQFGLE